MLILIPRAARADAVYWPGRRALAVVDAIAWPLLWLAAAVHARFDTGVVGRVVMALALVCAVSRVHRAIWRNERYRFTTWRWGVVIATLAFAGFVMKALG